MNILTNFMRSAMSQSAEIMGGEIVTWNDTNYQAVYHETSRSDNSDFGGFNPDGDSITLLIHIDQFSDLLPQLGDYVEVRGESWEIDSVSHGDVRVELSLTNKEKRGN